MRDGKWRLHYMRRRYLQECQSWGVYGRDISKVKRQIKSPECKNERD